MKLTAKTALGIDISHEQINLALLKKGADSIQLVRAAHGPVPAGVIKNGVVEKPSTLAEAVRKLMVKNRMGAHHQAVLSVIGSPVLMQILEPPENVPANIGEFVRDEVKHCAMLPAGKVTSDFCGLKTQGKSVGRRLLVAAAETQKLTDFAAALERKGLNIVAIEPASLAYVRACYHKRIAKKFDQNLLLAMVRQDVLTLYLFRNEVLDFVTTKQFESAGNDADRCIEWLAGEIRDVIRFYDFEAPGKRNKWDMEIVMDECDSFPKEKMDMLPTLLTEAAGLKIRTVEEASIDSPLANPEAAAGASAVAIGLAMKLLQPDDFAIGVNLFPPKLLEAKSEKKRSWVIANIAAVVFLLMILSISLFNAKLKRLGHNTDRKMRTDVVENMRTLSHERALLDEQVKDASQRLSNVSTAARGDYFLRWDRILEQIARAIPRNVRICSLSSGSDSTVMLEGQALSYEAVELFLKTLSKCEYIKSALLVGTEKDSESDKWIKYSVSCLLTERKEYQ
jgi:Tfp pilus assembly protein PilN